VLGWALILAHFVAQGFEALPGLPGQISNTIDLAGLELAGVAFIAFTTKSIVEHRRRQIVFCLAIGLPALFHSLLSSFELDYPWVHLLCLAAIFYGGAGLVIRWNKRLSWASRALLAMLLLAGTWSSLAALRHAYDEALIALLALAFTIPGATFYHNYKRSSPGVVSTSAGFLCWGMVFPLAALLDQVYPDVVFNPELWNVPKFFVAFGMILTLIEDKSLSLLEASEREHRANQQLEKFASITSRLLMGADPRSLCQESAEVIAQFSNFRRVAIEIGDDEGRLLLVGDSGLSEEARRELTEKVLRWITADVAQLCSIGRPIGPNSFLLKKEQLAQYEPVQSVLHYEANPYWEDGDEIFVPLRSTSGRYLGLITMDDPKDVTRVHPQELSKIELIAADLSVSIENCGLQRQLIRSEKLAAIGKLVAGFAHELNNPLASITGYSELLSDEMPSETAREKLEKVSRESRRMQAIIQNLLHFARRKTIERVPLDLELALHEGLALFDYRLRSEQIAVHTQIASRLPHIVGDEDQLKQVFINLLSNAVEAVEGAPERHISIEMFPRDENIVIRFLDSGPGFAEIDRAFDPFYTTKPIGKGTGLGLSTCYGLVKEHGGEIYVENLHPNGAAVTVELPRSPVESPLAVGAEC
jgi:signal transduction histidine kinase